jgi:ribosomal protein S18 acetylase RimI-like enzyme
MSPKKTSRLRRATHADVPSLVALMEVFYAESDFPLPTGPAARAFQRLLDESALGAVWIMEHEGQPARYVVLTVGYSMEFGGLRGFVDDLFVHPHFRRLGLATEALAVVQQECTNRGVRALLVETGPENDRAQRVYRRAGFEESGRLLLTLALEPAVHERE